MRIAICLAIAGFALVPSQGMAQSKAMQMANQNLARYGMHPSNMRFPMSGGRTFVMNQNYVPGVGFSSGFGVLNPRGQSFYSGQSSSFRGGGQSSISSYSRPGFSSSQSWIQGGGRSGSAFSFSNGQVSGGSSFLNNRNTGVRSFSQGFGNGRMASSKGWVQGGGLSGSRFAYSNGQVSGGSSFLNNRNTGVMSSRQIFSNTGSGTGTAVSSSRRTAGQGLRFVSSGGTRQRLFGGRGR